MKQLFEKNKTKFWNYDIFNYLYINKQKTFTKNVRIQLLKI